ncbi:calcium-dependent protein kinase 24-like [Eucalyptus grandis]|uniref:calcium-dependent protein kinase 24-like n=1 Tax=Eucalyptus grandis TaxID=71139 RepID=UPI00192EF01A|nr:calcium-dependent protein kinase 24-like [Eucalyptus grandis]
MEMEIARMQAKEKTRMRVIISADGSVDCVDNVEEHKWIQTVDKAPNVSLGQNVQTRIKQFSLMNKFKMKVLRVVADNLPDEQVDHIKEMFHVMDTDKNGDLTFEELKHGLHKYGQQVADPDVQMLMDAADEDGSGTLNCGEFVTMSVHLRRIGSDDTLLELLNSLTRIEAGILNSMS